MLEYCNIHRSFPNFKHSCDAWAEYSTIDKAECTLHYLENRFVKADHPLSHVIISHTIDADMLGKNSKRKAQGVEHPQTLAPLPPPPPPRHQEDEETDKTKQEYTEQTQKSTRTSPSPTPKRGNHNDKRTETHKNKTTQGKTLNKPPRRTKQQRASPTPGSPP